MYVLFRYVAVGLFISGVSISYGLLPPKYLRIPNFKSCLSTKDMGAWKAYCVPKEKPQSCAEKSWREFQNKKDLGVKKCYQ